MTDDNNVTNLDAWKSRKELPDRSNEYDRLRPMFEAILESCKTEDQANAYVVECIRQSTRVAPALKIPLPILLEQLAREYCDGDSRAEITAICELLRSMMTEMLDIAATLSDAAIHAEGQ